MRGRSKIHRPKFVLDTKYQDPLISKLVNKVMWGGKRTVAERLVYDALEKLAHERRVEPPVVLREVIDRAAPILEVKSRRVGGATYQVPMEVKPNRKLILVYRWLLDICRKGQGQSMSDRLYTEMKGILEGTGAVMKKREDLHKMAEANRAFAHFARY